MVRLWRVTTLLTNLVDFTITDDTGQHIFSRKFTPGTAMRAQRSGLVLAISFGRISPKNRIRKVRITVLSRKLAHAGSEENSSDKANDISTTMVTFTRLLAMSIVARRRSGIARRRRMPSLRDDSSSSSACCGVMEKNAISLPLTKAETKRQSTATVRATICEAPKATAPPASSAQNRGRILFGKGSISIYQDKVVLSR